MKWKIIHPSTCARTCINTKQYSPACTPLNTQGNIPNNKTISLRWQFEISSCADYF